MYQFCLELGKNPNNIKVESTIYSIHPCKISPLTLLHFATGFFSSNGLRKHAIYVETCIYTQVYVEKYMNIAIWFRISPRCPWDTRVFSS